MTNDHVDYDSIAGVYGQRYQANPLRGVAAALQALAREVDAVQVLEVGCGTGRWLPDLEAAGCEVVGLDLSRGMLAQARQGGVPARLVCGTAWRLPFAQETVDLVYCVNALHHFADQPGFIAEARRLLRPNGALAVIGANPHAGGQRDRWCVYQYFPETCDIDRRRFPPPETVSGWMREVGFARTAWQVAEHIVDRKAGREVLDSPFMQKHGTSQLVLLSDEAYAAGIARIKAAIAQAEASGETVTFLADIPLVMLVAYV